MLERDLGGMGEALFVQLCSEVGLICNPSNKDSAGWDFVVDFPSNFTGHPMMDKSPSPIECKIQVKSTDSSEKKVQITLSNMMRLCTSKLPSFITYIEYNGSNAPQALYVRHIDRELIFNTLKRARKNSATEIKKNLNKATLTVKFDHSHKLKKISGNELKSQITSYIPNGMEAYTENKNKQLKELGYENGGVRMKFQTNATTEYGHLIEASLGWRDKAKVRNIEWFDERFNISLPIDEMNSSEGQLSFGPEELGTPAAIKITNLTSNKSIRSSCNLITTPLARYAPDEHVKIRLLAPYFDVLIALKTGKLNYTFNNSENKMNLFSIRDSLTLMQWIYEQNDELEFELKSSKLPKPFKLITNTSERFKQDTSLINDCISANETIRNAIVIAQQLGIETQIQTSINDINKYSENINQMAWLFETPITDKVIKISFDEPNKSPPNEIDACCLIVLSTILGEFKIYVISTVSGKGKLYNNEYMLSNVKIKNEEIIDCPIDENITSILVEKTDLIAANYTNNNEEIVFINMFHDNNCD